jgi:hypothetical protein
MIKFTGFSIHSNENTLSALVSDEMCNYGIFKLKLLVNGMLQEWRIFYLNCICNITIDHVFDLFQHSVFVPSSSITALDDTNIIVRLGGDKGGKIMAYKFGVTVINRLQPNLPNNQRTLTWWLQSRHLIPITIWRQPYLTTTSQS